jgi:hypothetical protein
MAADSCPIKLTIFGTFCDAFWCNSGGLEFRLKRSGGNSAGGAD